MRIRLERAAGLAAGVVAGQSVVVLAGWAAAWPLFVRPPAHFIPMAPSTALAFFVLGAAVLLRLAWASSAAADRAATLAAWAVAGITLINIGFPARLDELLGGGAGAFGRVRLGVMSPVTAAAVLPLAAAIGLHGRLRFAASAGATLAAAVGATVALGYAFGTPLLYGGSTIPVALPTGLSLLVLGSAVVAAAGPDVWPIRPLLGPSPRARMLRAFLPATAGLVVLIGLLDARFGESLGADRVLVSAWLAVVGVALVTLLVSRLAQRIGAELDRAYADRHRAEQRYREVFEQTLAGVATTTLDGRILLCNDAFARMFGFESPQQLMGQPATTLYWDAEDRARVLSVLRETGQLRNFEFRMRRRDGKPVWILANVTLRDETSGEPRIEDTIIDITDRKALEQQLSISSCVFFTSPATCRHKRISASSARATRAA